MTAVNPQAPAVKRIMREMKEFRQHPSLDFTAGPISEDNIFEWHFTITGPCETAFEGGRYHGRIMLPPSYPFKPPDIVLLTPNGRFEISRKICLNVSGFHPEEWQPSWCIRTMLTAMRSFMPTLGKGAIGALECPDSERRRLAALSMSWRCSECDVTMRELPLADGDAADAVGSGAADAVGGGTADAVGSGAVDAVGGGTADAVGDGTPATDSPAADENGAAANQNASGVETENSP
eukprot:1076_1